ncbi:Sec-independent protein translocase protein TatB [Candidatus Pelagibacter sp.]|jgi:sec-independent protein translocase protein TatB|nr:Sec-independent protein translocase protein TatB [Candidatus Pelagibacter sp.]|tara:strand:- start:2038 stop:2256 length:219 start_codon:yes stop_codon:yes gene_type:complete
MPTIGWFEILLVVAVAVIVIGPKDFPFMLKKLGSWIGTTKQYIRSIQNEVADFDIDTNETEETTKKKDNDKV